MQATIALLPGDGIGPEIVAETRRVLNTVAGAKGHDWSFHEYEIGGAAIDSSGTALPEETLAGCRAADAILLGAVGGPKWDDPSATQRPEQGLLGLRKELALFANLRPLIVYPELAGASPLRAERLANVDIMVVRELTGGIYFGTPRFRESTQRGVRAVDTLEYHDWEIRRVVELACRLAQKRDGRVTSIDKANVLESSRLWREVASGVADAYPNVDLDHQLVDSAAMRLITHAQSFDVIVTSNMFGDILTDEASVLAGSLGLLPSASLGEGKLGVYEPVHGSAPDIAGQGIANPLATIMSAAMLLRHSLELADEAEAIEAAVSTVISEGGRTVDLGGTLSSREMTDHVLRVLEIKLEELDKS
ncbi:MAG: 3-isopropylmalate dehydrogenase [Myxococcota bacterium]